MGKIRIKTLGDEELEKQQKEENKKKREAKKAATTRLQSSEVIADGGQTKDTEAKAQNTDLNSGKIVTKHGKTVVARKSATKDNRSKKYKAVAKLIDKKKVYQLNEALELLPKLHLSKFDETVELHVNTIETGINGNLNLPHGTGKKVRVVIADEALIKEIESGKINFDILLAQPSMMPKLAKVARVLGPRGLMPNPKNGTISQNPKEAAKKFEAGQVRFKTEAKTPIIHLAVGKLSFGDKKLFENIQTVFGAIPSSKIKSATLKSTMSPGIKINTSNI